MSADELGVGGGIDDLLFRMGADFGIPRTRTTALVAAGAVHNLI